MSQNCEKIWKKALETIVRNYLETIVTKKTVFFKSICGKEDISDLANDSFCEY